MSRFILSEHPQNTPEWFADRVGRVTGSRAHCITAKGKGGAESVQRRNYRAQLVSEILTGQSQEEDAYQSRDMLNGQAREPYADMAYEAATGEMLEKVGFAYLPDIAAGCSVDAFVQGRRGLVEVKCPKIATHIEYLLAARVPPEYVPQITHNLWVTGCEFADFVSYSPALPDGLQLFHVRASREEFDLAGYEIAVFDFLREVKALEQRLRERMPLKQAA